MAFYYFLARIGGIIVPQFPILLSDTGSYAFFTFFAFCAMMASLRLPETLDKNLPSNCAELERQFYNQDTSDREPLLADS